MNSKRLFSAYPQALSIAAVGLAFACSIAIVQAQSNTTAATAPASNNTVRAAAMPAVNNAAANPATSATQLTPPSSNPLPNRNGAPAPAGSGTAAPPAPSHAFGNMAVSTNANVSQAFIDEQERRLRTMELHIKKLEDEMKQLKSSYAAHRHEVHTAVPSFWYARTAKGTINAGDGSFLIPIVKDQGGTNMVFTTELPN